MSEPEGVHGQPAAGWYPDPSGQPVQRWWDGTRWTEHTAPFAAPASAGRSVNRAAVSWVVALLAVIGCCIASFTQVSLLSGTTTVWVGVALTALAVVLAVVLKCRRGVLILSVLLLAIAVGSGIYDEVQLQHKRDEISNLFN